jgi:hypothetical protein
MHEYEDSNSENHPLSQSKGCLQARSLSEGRPQNTDGSRSMRIDSIPSKVFDCIKRRCETSWEWKIQRAGERNLPALSPDELTPTESNTLPNRMDRIRGLCKKRQAGIPPLSPGAMNSTCALELRDRTERSPGRSRFLRKQFGEQDSL